MKRLAAFALAAALMPSCTQIVRYTDDLTLPSGVRTLFTRTPATFGGTVGFLVGVPVEIAALPGTYIVYSTQDEASRDAQSIFLFPSFVLWRVGALLGAPFDLLEWGLWRWWQPADSLTPEEQERRELELDENVWPDYPVEQLHPRAVAPPDR